MRVDTASTPDQIKAADFQVRRSQVILLSTPFHRETALSRHKSRTRQTQLGNQSACGIVAQANLTAIFRAVLRAMVRPRPNPPDSRLRIVGSAERFEHFLDAFREMPGAVYPLCATTDRRRRDEAKVTCCRHEARRIVGEIGDATLNGDGLARADCIAIVQPSARQAKPADICRRPSSRDQRSSRSAFSCARFGSGKIDHRAGYFLDIVEITRRRLPQSIVVEKFHA